MKPSKFSYNNPLSVLFFPTSMHLDHMDYFFKIKKKNYLEYYTNEYDSQNESIWSKQKGCVTQQIVVATFLKYLVIYLLFKYESILLIKLQRQEMNIFCSHNFAIRNAFRFICCLVHALLTFKHDIYLLYETNIKIQ